MGLAGSEEYDRLRPLYYKEKDVTLFCFSVASPSSFENIQEKWVPEVRHHQPGLIFILVGTQVDLRDDEATKQRLARQRQACVRQEDGQKLAEQLGAVKYIEVCAKTSFKLEQLMSEVREQAYYSTFLSTHMFTVGYRGRIDPSRLQKETGNHMRHSVTIAHAARFLAQPVWSMSGDMYEGPPKGLSITWPNSDGRYVS